jgi:phosphopantetheine--protein transferase-like protein
MTLKEIVAKLAGRAPEEIGADFSLNSPGLEGSMRRALLVASIRRHLKKDAMQAALAGTYAELEALVEGKPAPPKAPAAPLADFPGLRCGVDLEELSKFPGDFRSDEFYASSFSPAEIEHCLGQENPRAHFAARWCAKEALKKCDPAFLETPMAGIEVLRSAQGGVFLQAGGRRLPHAVSLSHTEHWAVAFVVK